MLAAPGEEELMQVGASLIRAGIPFVPIFEPDAPWDGALMAIGVCPGRKEALRRHLSRLPLLK